MRSARASGIKGKGNVQYMIKTPGTGGIRAGQRHRARTLRRWPALVMHAAHRAVLRQKTACRM